VSGSCRKTIEQSGAYSNRLECGAAPLTLRSRSAHMLWCVVGADDGQFSQIWSDVVISHTAYITYE